MRPLAYLAFAALTTVAAAGCPTGQLTGPNSQAGETTLPLAEPKPDVPLPAAFPRDVPVYNRARVADAVDEVNGFFVALETKDAPSRVLVFYHGRLREYGWKIEGPEPQEEKEPIDPNMIVATKGSRLLLMSCSPVENETRVLLSVSYLDPLGG